MEAQSTVQIPRVAIRFCTQCKWNLRAAYYAQELLQTFGTTIGEISLVPVTGGIFDITLYHMYKPDTNDIVPDTTSDSISEKTAALTLDHDAREGSVTPSIAPNATTQTLVDIPTRNAVQSTLIWDRKRDGGFPETKELKHRIRNVIDPQKDMGHIDRSLKKANNAEPPETNVDSTAAKDRSSIIQVKTEVEKPQATGGESLQFGSNIEPVDAKKSKDTNAQTKDCEDCK